MAEPKRPTKAEIRDIVHSPNDAVAAALETIRERRTTVGVGARTGIETLDEYLLPARPGELVTVIGQSSNYKSGLMQWWARHTAEQIVAEKIVDQCAVYVTWEQAIEEMLVFDLAATARISATDIFQGKVSDEEMRRLEEQVGARRSVMPLYLIGHSLGEGKARPRLTLDAIAHALAMIRTEFGLTPRIIMLDYLQQIDPGQGEDRRMQVFYNVYRCKDMSLAMACPVVLGCQANRRVYAEDWGVPGMADGLETSNIEHTSDKMLGVWMPKTKHEQGATLKAENGQTLTVTDNLLIVKVLKQKMGPAGRWFPLWVDPATNFIGPMDTATSDEPPAWYGEREGW